MNSGGGTPAWVLTGAYWFHMAATVLWIGGLFFQSVLLPGAIGKLSPKEQSLLMGRLRKRFQPVAWICLAVLIVTGLVQMSASKSYTGFLSIENAWARAILLKHILVGSMIGVAALQTWWIGPKLDELSLRLALGEEVADGGYRRHRAFTTLNFLLSLLVLVLTAIARTA